MDSVKDQPDVLGKIDALLTRHRAAAPPQEAKLPEQHPDRTSIPILSEVVDEPGTIPVLTDALLPGEPVIPEGAIPSSAEPMLTDRTNEPVANRTPDEKTRHRMEDFLIRELEDRIAMEFAASLDRALTEMLENSREHIRHAVREALENHLGSQSGDISTESM